MNIQFQSINEHNRQQVLQLSIKEDQTGYIESIPQCLEEADKNTHWCPLAIVDNDTCIGFAMVGFFPWENLPFGRVWFDRFLLDKRYQGKGLGTAVVQRMIPFLQKKYHRHKIYLSVYPDNAVAIHLYQKAGFEFTGKQDEHGEWIMIYDKSGNKNTQ